MVLIFFASFDSLISQYSRLNGPEIGVYNVSAAHKVNGGVYKVNEPLLNSLSTRVNKTHATFTNVNAAAPDAGGDVSKTSQVRSAYFRNHSSTSERALLRDRDMQWRLQKVGRVEATRFDGFENVSPPHSDKIETTGCPSAHRRAKRSGALGAQRRVVRMGCRGKWRAEGKQHLRVSNVLESVSKRVLITVHPAQLFSE